MPLPDERPALGAFGPTLVNDTPVIDPTRNLDADVVNALRVNVSALVSASPLGWAFVKSGGSVSASGGRLAGCTATLPSAGRITITPADGATPVYVAALVTAQDYVASWTATAAVLAGGVVQVRTVDSTGTPAAVGVLVLVY